MIDRYIVVQAVKTEDNKIIPVWDKRISFKKHEDYENIIEVKDDPRTYHKLVEVVYDLKTRKISTGISLDFYPSDTKFVKDEIVYVEESHSTFYETKIVEIKFEEFDMSILRGSEVLEYYKDIKEDIIKTQIYAIKHWKPTYVLSNGEKIKWEYQLNHKSKKQ